MAGNQFKYLNIECIDNQNDNNKWINDNDLITKLGDNNRRKVAVSRSGRYKAKNKYRETINTDLFQQEIIKDDKSIILNDKKIQQSDTDKTTITSTSKNIINYQIDDQQQQQQQQQQTHGNLCIKRHSKTSEHFEIKI